MTYWAMLCGASSVVPHPISGSRRAPVGADPHAVNQTARRPIRPQTWGGLPPSAPARNAIPASVNPSRLFVIRHCRPASFLSVLPIRHTPHRGIFLAGKRVSCTDPHGGARSPKKPGPPPERPGTGRIDGQIDMQFQLRGPRLKHKGSANEKRPPQRSRRARY